MEAQRTAAYSPRSLSPVPSGVRSPLAAVDTLSQRSLSPVSSFVPRTIHSHVTAPRSVSPRGHIVQSSTVDISLDPSAWADLPNNRLFDLASYMLHGQVTTELLRNLERRDLLALMVAHHKAGPSSRQRLSSVCSSSGFSAMDGLVAATTATAREVPIEGTTTFVETMSIPGGSHRIIHTGTSFSNVPCTNLTSRSCSPPPLWTYSTLSANATAASLSPRLSFLETATSSASRSPSPPSMRMSLTTNPMDATTTALMMTGGEAHAPQIMSRRSPMARMSGRFEPPAVSSVASNATASHALLQPVLRQQRVYTTKSERSPTRRVSAPGGHGARGRTVLSSGVEASRTVSRMTSSPALVVSSSPSSSRIDSKAGTKECTPRFSQSPLPSVVPPQLGGAMLADPSTQGPVAPVVVETIAMERSSMLASSRRTPIKTQIMSARDSTARFGSPGSVRKPRSALRTGTTPRNPTSRPSSSPVFVTSEMAPPTIDCGPDAISGFEEQIVTYVEQLPLGGNTVSFAADTELTELFSPSRSDVFTESVASPRPNTTFAESPIMAGVSSTLPDIPAPSPTPTKGNAGYDALLASNLAAADLELNRAQSAAARLSAARVNAASTSPTMVRSIPIPPLIPESQAADVTIGDGCQAEPACPSDGNAEINLKMQEIEVLQKLENIFRIASSSLRHTSDASPEAQGDAAVDDKYPVDSANETTLDGLRQELHAVTGQLAPTGGSSPPQTSEPPQMLKPPQPQTIEVQPPPEDRTKVANESVAEPVTPVNVTPVACHNDIPIWMPSSLPAGIEMYQPSDFQTRISILDPTLASD